VKLGKNFSVEEYGELYYNNTGMILQWYYNGITMVLVSMLEICGCWKVKFPENFLTRKARTITACALMKIFGGEGEEFTRRDCAEHKTSCRFLLLGKHVR